MLVLNFFFLVQQYIREMSITDSPSFIALPIEEKERHDIIHAISKKVAKLKKSDLDTVIRNAYINFRARVTMVN